MKRKLLSVILAVVLCFSLAISAAAAYDVGVWDEADLLTAEEEAWLSAQLVEISRLSQAEIVIMTLESAGDRYIDELVESVYDTMDFGYGESRDGVLLLICMDIREYRILSNGYAAAAIDPYDIDCIGDEITPYLSAGDYAEAFDLFADQCAYYLDGYVNGFPFDFGGSLVTCLIIGLVLAVIVVLVLKGQLKSVRQKNRAHDYIKPGSMNLTVVQDIYLYRNVTRTKKDTGNGSRSGGSSRSVGGGKF